MAHRSGPSESIGRVGNCGCDGVSPSGRIGQGARTDSSRVWRAADKTIDELVELKPWLAPALGREHGIGNSRARLASSSAADASGRESRVDAVHGDLPWLRGGVGLDAARSRVLATGAGLRGVAASCGTCRLGAAVKSGVMTPAESNAAMYRWGRAAIGPVAFSTGGPEFESTVKSSGGGACGPAQRSRIRAAIRFIRNNIEQIPGGSNVQQVGGGPANPFEGCLSPRCFSWLPPQYPRNAKELVEYTLNAPASEKVLRVHCNPCLGSTVGWAFPHQYNERVMDVHLCDSNWGRTPFTSIPRIACLIVHELLHLWGVDESEAERAEPLNWGCYGPRDPDDNPSTPPSILVQGGFGITGGDGGSRYDPGYGSALDPRRIHGTIQGRD